MDEIKDNKRQVVEKRWSHLQEEIVCLIKSNLFGRDYDVFGAVCRPWRSTPPPIDSPYRYSPCLMVINRENFMSVFFHPLYHRSYSMDIPELHNAYILASNYGWLLVYLHQFHVFFFNPFTREKIELPDLEEDYHCWTFTSPPTSDDCLIIGISGYSRRTFVGILRRGQHRWEAHSYTNDESFRCSHGNPVLFNKLYYFLGINGNIGVFDPDKLTWNVFLTPNVHEAQYISRSFLAEDDGKLVVACLSPNYNSEVRLYSLGLTNMVWEVKQTIGDKAMYAGCGSTFIKRGVDGRMSNKICFPFHSGRKAVLYCLADKRFHLFDGECSPSETKEMMREKCNAWIQPNFETIGGVGCKLTW